MCGLVGLASVAPCADRDWLAVGRDAMSHRGPDDAGLWWSPDGRVGLAHRRLSIVDLTSAGHQPMHLREHGLSIVFNGEIYNFTELRDELQRLGHSFHSHSDTEVLLTAYAQWGTESLARLNGMFAFALYDARQRRLLLVRDRAGEKPLFYHLADGQLHFASELKALMAKSTLPRRVNAEALDCYLAMGFVPGARCILEGFNKLEPAHALTFDLANGSLRSWRYWALPSPAVGVFDSQGEAQLLDELETLLEDAVRRQLVADVPVGILLSGGVDSSLITAMAARHASVVRTFTVSFPGHGLQDEARHARLIADHFGTQHTELAAEPGLASLLPQLARQYDEPLVDSSIMPTFLVSRLVRQNCTVALGGDGGDELFGGYDHYNRLLWLQRRLGVVPRPVRRWVAAASERLLPVGLKGRNWLQALEADFERGLPLIASYFDATTRARLMRRSQRHPLVAESVHQERIPEQTGLLERAMRMDFSNYLPEDILVKVDRASMLNSLEVRAPLLDYRLIEFAFGRVPEHLKASARSSKVLLKRLAARMLPPEFDRQRKQGFSIPLAKWLKSGPFRDLFWSVLTDPGCLFDPEIVRGLLSGQDRGRSNSERLFALVQFELWRREYGAVCSGGGSDNEG